MKRCIRPLIGKVPYEILQKYGDIIAERMSEYADNTGKVGAIGGFIWGVIITVLAIKIWG